MRQLVTGGVRTAVQVGVAAVVAWGASVGIDIDADALEAVLFSVTTGVVTIVLNYATEKFPVLGSLLSLGLARGGPSYEK